MRVKACIILRISPKLFVLSVEAESISARFDIKYAHAARLYEISGIKGAKMT